MVELQRVIRRWISLSQRGNFDKDDPWEIGKNYPAAIAIQGDPRATLSELGEALRAQTTPASMREAGFDLSASARKKKKLSSN